MVSTALWRVGADGGVVVSTESGLFPKRTVTMRLSSVKVT